MKKFVETLGLEIHDHKHGNSTEPDADDLEVGPEPEELPPTV
jgi:hypothetical protein